MRFLKTNLRGAWLIELEPFTDHRGSFARTFCTKEFSSHGLEVNFVQHSTSHTYARGAVRGMHFQKAPHSEVKVVSCVIGAIWDVMVDLRPDSPTFRQWQGFELSAANRRQLYIPKGCAHGFQTLTEGAGVHYLISEFYEPAASAGVRYDDPAFGIEWPLPVTSISEKDQHWPDFTG